MAPTIFSDKKQQTRSSLRDLHFRHLHHQHHHSQHQHQQQQQQQQQQIHRSSHHQISPNARNLPSSVNFSQRTSMKNRNANSSSSSSSSSVGETDVDFVMVNGTRNSNSNINSDSGNGHSSAVLFKVEEDSQHSNEDFLSDDDNATNNQFDPEDQQNLHAANRRSYETAIDVDNEIIGNRNDDDNDDDLINDENMVERRPVLHSPVIRSFFKGELKTQQQQQQAEEQSCRSCSEDETECCAYSRFIFNSNQSNASDSNAKINNNNNKSYFNCNQGEDSKTYLDLCEIKNTEGLLDIAIKTINLVKRNQVLQRRLAQLQTETSEFIKSVLANPQNQHFRDKLKQNINKHQCNNNNKIQKAKIN